MARSEATGGGERRRGGWMRTEIGTLRRRLSALPRGESDSVKGRGTGGATVEREPNRRRFAGHSPSMIDRARQFPPFRDFLKANTEIRSAIAKTAAERFAPTAKLISMIRPTLALRVRGRHHSSTPPKNVTTPALDRTPTNTRKVSLETLETTHLRIVRTILRLPYQTDGSKTKTCNQSR